MFDRFKNLMQAKGSARATEMSMDEQVAVCAILIEAAEADRQFAPTEYQEMVEQLRAYFSLSDEEARTLITETERERDSSIDLFPFTNAIARNYSPQQKEDLLAMVWQVILADDKLDPYEDQLARRLQTMLSVNHSVLMAAKARARAVQASRAGAPEGSSG